MKSELLTSSEDVIQYYAHSQLQTNWAQLALLRFPINNNDRILDIGCRDGKNTAELSTKIPFGRIIVLDSSNEMIRFASSHFQTADYPNLSFQAGDALNLAFKAEFDVVLSFAVLNWAQDQLTILRNIYDSLTQRGRILLVLPANSDTTLKSLGDIVRSRAHWKNLFQDYSHNRWYFTADEYHDLLEGAGFSQVSVKQLDTNTLFSTIDDLMQWWTPVSTAVQFLPTDFRDAFLREVMQLYLSYYPANPENGVSLHWPMIVATAVKL